MMTIYNCKPAFQRLLRPLSNWLARHHVSPNQITILALLLSFAGGVCILIEPNARWPMVLLPFILFIRMVLNAIDGMIAREFNRQSALGTFLNEIGDVLSDTFLYLPFAAIHGLETSLIILIVVFAVISEMTGVVATLTGASRRYDGPMGKSDRAFAFGLIAVLLAITRLTRPVVNVILAIILIMVIITIINRIRQALKETKHAA